MTISSDAQAAVARIVQLVKAQDMELDQFALALDWVMQRVEQPPDAPAHVLVMFGQAQARAAAARNRNSMEAAPSVVTFPSPEPEATGGGVSNG